MRTHLACLALALSGSLALAAPAPFTREVADAKLNLRGSALEKVTETLLSNQFAKEVVKDQRVLALSCLKGKPNAEEWLRGRLKVKPSDGSSVRLCLEGCPAKEAVVVLSAVLDAYVAKVDKTLPNLKLRLEQAQRMEARVKELVAVKAGGRNIETILERYKERVDQARVQVEKAKSAWIAQQPKPVRSGR
jgi:hypothetical protein